MERLSHEAAKSRPPLRIGTRLAIGFGLVGLMLVAVAVLSIMHLNDAAAKTDEIVNDRHLKTALAFQVKGSVNDLARNLRNAALAKAPEDKRNFLDKVGAAVQDSAEKLGQLDKLINVPMAREIFNGVTAARLANSAVRAEVVRLIEADARDQAIELLLTSGIAKQTAYFAELDKMIAFQQDLMRKVGQNSIESGRTAGTLVTLISIGAVLLAIIVGTLIIRGLLKELGGEPAYAADVVKSIAARDLTVAIDSRPNDHGSMLAAVRDMRDDLSSAVAEIRVGTETIAAAAQQIAAGNADLSARTEEQASSLEETASSMEELTSTVRQNADNAQQANQLALAASDIAVQGGAMVAEVVHTMGAINTSAKQIADIIGVIDGIAFQTNILALNAAVEAARAGDQGRGFAVVATEVRNLAQRSATAAKQIKGLINNSVEQIDAGSKLVDQAGVTTRQVVEAIQRVTSLMGDISAASREQTAGIEQVNQAISQMDQVTQQNAALVEEAAAAAESLQEQADKLARVVGRFKLGGWHQAATVRPPAGPLPTARFAPLALNAA
ncbi:MAG TPA: methyl-accepting chemotaxis protein [Duganella sp.]|uniref:methyl-accepting chemotaxis protein n=1 Tax=Duganella sp. TaxID=1904440 RepID=UPI002ED3238D